MATWVRQGTGTAPTAFNSDLVGNYALDNATAPGDFDPAAVTSIRCQWTITGSGFTDDSWNNVAGCAVVTGTTELSQHPGEGSTNNQNVARSTDHTDSTGIPTGLSVAQWEAALVRGDGVLIPDEWSSWNKVMGPDGATMAVSALTVTITYTPATPSFTGTITAVQDDDEGAFSGTVSPPPTTGTITGTQTDDAADFAGTHTPPAITGTITGVQDDDEGEFTGTSFPPPITGTLTTTQADDVSTISGTVSAGGTLPVPTNLIATAISATRIDLSWDTVVEADAYDLERDSVVIAHKVTATTYEDEGLSPDTEYTYRVRSTRSI